MLFRPTFYRNKIIDITPSEIKEMGITALILDVDNTLADHVSPDPSAGILSWLDDMQQNGIKLVILSNNFNKRVSKFANKVNLDFISMGLKPLPFGIFRCIKKLGTDKKHVAIIGDQVFTDIMAGNMAGITSFLLVPLKPETNKFMVFKRKMEKIILKDKR